MIEACWATAAGRGVRGWLVSALSNADSRLSARAAVSGAASAPANASEARKRESSLVFTKRELAQTCFQFV